MIKFKRILRNPWTVTVGASLISTFLLKLVDIFVGTNIFDGEMLKLVETL